MPLIPPGEIRGTVIAAVDFEEIALVVVVVDAEEQTGVLVTVQPVGDIFGGDDVVAGIRIDTVSGPPGVGRVDDVDVDGTLAHFEVTPGTGLVVDTGHSLEVVLAEGVLILAVCVCGLISEPAELLLHGLLVEVLVTKGVGRHADSVVKLDVGVQLVDVVILGLVGIVDVETQVILEEAGGQGGRGLEGLDRLVLVVEISPITVDAAQHAPAGCGEGAIRIVGDQGRGAPAEQVALRGH